MSIENNKDMMMEDNGSDSSHRWYFLQVQSGFEKRALEIIKQRAAEEGFSEHFSSILVPTEEVMTRRGGKNIKSERKFFPGYVLVNMAMDDDVWHFITKLPRVYGFVGGSSGQPAAISKKEADAILKRMEEGETAQPRHSVVFEPGEVVRIKEGPFADFDGVVQDVNYEKSRLQVSVVIFGRATPVDLEFGQVEKN